MSKQRQPERRDVLHEAVYEVAETAMNEEFRFADCLRVEQLTDDAENDGVWPILAGWISEPQWDQEKSDG